MGWPILSPGKKLTGEKTDRYSGQCFVMILYVPVNSWPILSPGKKLTGEKTDRYSGQCFVMILYVPVNNFSVMSGHFPVLINVIENVIQLYKV